MSPGLCEQFCFGLEQVGDFLFKNSYILSNIIMMVCLSIWRGNIRFFKYHFFNVGVEYRLSQLVNIYISSMGQSSVYNTESTKKYVTMQSICGHLCWAIAISTVFVRNEFNRGWTAVYVGCKSNWYYNKFESSFLWMSTHS